MNEKSHSRLPAPVRDATLLIVLCLLAAVVGAVWQYKQDLDMTNRAVEYVSRTQDQLAEVDAQLDQSQALTERGRELIHELSSLIGEVRSFPSVVSIVSEELKRDLRCDIADALVTRMLTTDEARPHNLEYVALTYNGEKLEGSSAIRFQTPDASWAITFMPNDERHPPRISFYEFPRTGSASVQLVRDDTLDCTADAGYFEEIAPNPGETDDDRWDTSFGEPDFLAEEPCDEHYRSYWQEELDHAYRVAAQAFGL